MNGRRVSWVVLSLLALLAVQFLPAGAASAQDGTISIVDSVLFVVQGENDISNGSEDVDDFYALRIVNYTLPYDSTRINVKVPQDARDMLLIASGAVVDSSGYGWEDDGLGNDLFFIDVPSTHSRTSYFATEIDNETEFLSPGSVLYNTSYGSGALQLVDNASDGFFISSNLSVPDVHSVLSANITLWGSSLENITVRASNNNGTDWVTCPNATRVNFTAAGTDFLVRLDFIGNASVESITAQSEFIATFTYFDVHLSYSWTEPFVDGSATIDLTDIYDFEPEASCFLMLFVLGDFNVTGENITLALGESGMSDTYPDKVLYVNYSFRPGPTTQTTLTVIAPEKQTEYGLYLLAGVLCAAFLGAIAYAKFGKRRTVVSEDALEGDSDESVLDESPALALDDHRKSLVERKKSLLREIETTKKQVSLGEISRQEAETRLSAAKKEFKVIRNELNKLPRGEDDIEQATPGTVSPEYEAALAALARIDADREKGRLTDDSHKSLRKEYLAKAAKLAAEKDAGRSSADAEKTMLLEAIAALDEEHGRGEISDAVYSDLSRSYKGQLADHLKKSEESEEGE